MRKCVILTRELLGWYYSDTAKIMAANSIRDNTHIFRLF